MPHYCGNQVWELRWETPVREEPKLGRCCSVLVLWINKCVPVYKSTKCVLCIL